MANALVRVTPSLLLPQSLELASAKAMLMPRNTCQREMWFLEYKQVHRIAGYSNAGLDNANFRQSNQIEPTPGYPGPGGGWNVPPSH